MSPLTKMEAEKGHRVATLSKKRRPSFASHFDRELWKLECSANYNQSSIKETVFKFP